MKPARLLKHCSTFAIAFLSLLLCCGILHSQTLPNFVIIFADDMGYADISPYGAKNRTPNLARMAKEGVRFTDFYVAQPVCSASRAALLTGCYPNRIGILGAMNPYSKEVIHSNELTLAEVLKTRGYATAIYGKWHLGYQPQFLPTRHGFNDYFGLPYSNDMWPKHPLPPGHIRRYHSSKASGQLKRIQINANSRRGTLSEPSSSLKRTEINPSSFTFPTTCHMCRCSFQANIRANPNVGCMAT